MAGPSRRAEPGRRCQTLACSLRGAGSKGRRRKAKALPKLALAVASACHLIVSFWAGAGSGSDSPHLERLLYNAWRRVPNRRFKAAFDAGFDGEHNHELARRDMGIGSLIPATIGRPSKRGGPPTGRRRRHMCRGPSGRGGRAATRSGGRSRR